MRSAFIIGAGAGRRFRETRRPRTRFPALDCMRLSNERETAVFIYVQADERPRARKRKSHSEWHAVTIVACKESCDPARAQTGKRYLSSEALRLPLVGCDAERCDCRYRHFDDRRGGPRRQEELSGAAPKSINQDRRLRRGRRADDSTA